MDRRNLKKIFNMVNPLIGFTLRVRNVKKITRTKNGGYIINVNISRSRGCLVIFLTHPKKVLYTKTLSCKTFFKISIKIKTSSGRTWWHHAG